MVNSSEYRINFSLVSRNNNGLAKMLLDIAIGSQKETTEKRKEGYSVPGAY
jgi:hypothetical protein